MADKEIKFERTFTPITDDPVPTVDPIDALIEQRNAVSLEAEAISDGMGAAVDVRLGVANRHINRVLTNQTALTPGIEAEIVRSIVSARDWLADQKAGK